MGRNYEFSKFLADLLDKINVDCTFDQQRGVTKIGLYEECVNWWIVNGNFC